MALIKNVSLVDSWNILSTWSIISWYVNFDNINYTITKDTASNLSLKVSLNALTTGLVNNNFSVYVDDFVAEDSNWNDINIWNGKYIDGVLWNSKIEDVFLWTYKIYKTMITVAKQKLDTTTLSNWTNDIYKFSITANTTWTWSIKKFTFEVWWSISGENAINNISWLNLYISWSKVSWENLMINKNLNFKTVSFEFTWNYISGYKIPAWSSITFKVSADITDTRTNDNLITKLLWDNLDTNNFIWSDKANSVENNWFNWISIMKLGESITITK